MNILARQTTNNAALYLVYDEPGMLRRLGMMAHGLRQPRQSRAYKAALIEMQRLSAPVMALLLPIAVILLLIVMSGDAAPQNDVIVTRLIDERPASPLITVDPPKSERPERPELELETPFRQHDVAFEVKALSPVPPDAQIPPTLQMEPAFKGKIRFTTLYAENRSGDNRLTLLRQHNGDDQTEAAVLRALRWLKQQQQPDGAWPRNKVAMTGLALLTFLSHGECPGASPEFGTTVQRGVEYLLRVQNQETGVLPPGNYEHPIAAYALCEAYGMTRHPNVKIAAEKALLPIIQGQHPTGGWTYHMNPNADKETGQYRDDTSYMGWCAQALKAAKLAGVHAEGLDKAMKLAVRGFKKNADPDGGFGYTGPGAGGLTGVGTLCLQLLGAAQAPEVKKSLALMAAWMPTFIQCELAEADLKQARLAQTADAEQRRFINGSAQYYFYYVTQCKFHEGGKSWDAWNAAMKERYVKAQKIKTCAVQDENGRLCDVGWWENGDKHSDRPVMDTCLAALQLMVYYRTLQTTGTAAVNSEQIIASVTDEQDIKVLVGNL